MKPLQFYFCLDDSETLKEIEVEFLYQKFVWLETPITHKLLLFDFPALDDESNVFAIDADCMFFRA